MPATPREAFIFSLSFVPPKSDQETTAAAAVLATTSCLESPLEKARFLMSFGGSCVGAASSMQKRAAVDDSSKTDRAQTARHLEERAWKMEDRISTAGSWQSCLLALSRPTRLNRRCKQKHLLWHLAVTNANFYLDPPSIRHKLLEVKIYVSPSRRPLYPPVVGAAAGWPGCPFVLCASLVAKARSAGDEGEYGHK